MAGFTRRRIRFIWRYVRGDTPWDSGIVPPEITAWVAAHDAHRLPPGRALDLGCGTGTTSLSLAGHGWQVTGVDFAPNAIRRARRRAQQQGLAARAIFYSANVARLDFLSGDPPFDLALDIGCLHSLDAGQRAGYAAHLARLTRPGAAYLLYAFLPRTGRDGRPMGIDTAGLAALFGPAFELVTVTLGEELTAPIASGWYTFRRTDQV